MYNLIIFKRLEKCRLNMHEYISLVQITCYWSRTKNPQNVKIKTIKQLFLSLLICCVAGLHAKKIKLLKRKRGREKTSFDLFPTRYEPVKMSVCLFLAPVLHKVQPPGTASCLKRVGESTNGELIINSQLVHSSTAVTVKGIRSTAARCVPCMTSARGRRVPSLPMPMFG